MMGTVKAAITGGPSSPLCFPISAAFQSGVFSKPTETQSLGWVPACRQSSLS